MLIETLSTGWRKARSVNQSSGTFVAKIPVAAEPTGDAGTATGQSIIELGTGGTVTQNACLLLLYGTGSDNNTASARVIGWRHIKSTAPTNGLYVPVLLAEFACVLSSTYPGVAGSPLIATEFLADTITLTTGNANVSVEIVSPGTVSANSGIAHAILDLKGFQKLEVTFSTGSSATDMNALLTLL